MGIYIRQFREIHERCSFDEIFVGSVQFAFVEDD